MRCSNQPYSLRNTVKPNIGNNSNLPYYLSQQVASARRKHQNTEFKKYHYNISHEVEKKLHAKKVFSQNLERDQGTQKNNYLKPQKKYSIDLEIPHDKYLLSILNSTKETNILNQFCIENAAQTTDSEFFQDNSKGHHSTKKKQEIPLNKQLQFLLHENLSERKLIKCFRQFHYLELKEDTQFKVDRKKKTQNKLIDQQQSLQIPPQSPSESFHKSDVQTLIKELVKKENVRATKLLHVADDKSYYRPTSAQKRNSISKYDRHIQRQDLKRATILNLKGKDPLAMQKRLDKVLQLRELYEKKKLALLEEEKEEEKEGDEQLQNQHQQPDSLQKKLIPVENAEEQKKKLEAAEVDVINQAFGYEKIKRPSKDDLNLNPMIDNKMRQPSKSSKKKRQTFVQIDISGKIRKEIQEKKNKNMINKRNVVFDFETPNDFYFPQQKLSEQNILETDQISEMSNNSQIQSQQPNLQQLEEGPHSHQKAYFQFNDLKGIKNKTENQQTFLTDLNAQSQKLLSKVWNIKIQNQIRLSKKQAAHPLCSSSLDSTSFGNFIKRNKNSQQLQQKDTHKQNKSQQSAILLRVQQWEHGFQQLTESAINKHAKIQSLSQMQRKKDINKNSVFVQANYLVNAFYQQCLIEADEFISAKYNLEQQIAQGIKDCKHAYYQILQRDNLLFNHSPEFQHFIELRQFKRKLIQYLLSQLQANIKPFLVKAYQDNQQERMLRQKQDIQKAQKKYELQQYTNANE